MLQILVCVTTQVRKLDSQALPLYFTLCVPETRAQHGNSNLGTVSKFMLSCVLILASWSLIWILSYPLRKASGDLCLSPMLTQGTQIWDGNIDNSTNCDIHYPLQGHVHRDQKTFHLAPPLKSSTTSWEHPLRTKSWARGLLWDTEDLNCNREHRIRFPNVISKWSANIHLRLADTPVKWNLPSKHTSRRWPLAGPNEEWRKIQTNATLSMLRVCWKPTAPIWGESFSEETK